MLHIPLLPLLDRCQDICPSNIPSRHMYENGQGIGPTLMSCIGRSHLAELPNLLANHANFSHSEQLRLAL